MLRVSGSRPASLGVSSIGSDNSPVTNLMSAIRPFKGTSCVFHLKQGKEIEMTPSTSSGRILSLVSSHVSRIAQLTKELWSHVSILPPGMLNNPFPGWWLRRNKRIVLLPSGCLRKNNTPPPLYGPSERQRRMPFTMCWNLILDISVIVFVVFNLQHSFFLSSININRQLEYPRNYLDLWIRPWRLFIFLAWKLLLASWFNTYDML
jgi:hypothetical protein